MSKDYKIMSKDFYEALARAKEAVKNGMVSQSFVDDIFCIESEENEDERIRKALCDIVRDMPYMETELRAHGLTVKKTLAYLEKQKEQRPTWSEEDEEFLDSILCSIGIADKQMHVHTYENKKQWLLSRLNLSVLNPTGLMNKENK